ncbi:MAG: CpcT/CpeT family chromophore lyase, partial [Steroidobacteraceae bacterium]|nr:CpcT/CpeT family chromophore lyase [Steroidobacteraceae bacterium]MDW8258459.1 CpcT/CpeT family chromophore lyase [Gammaproteobacteria bacterium]
MSRVGDRKSGWIACGVVGLGLGALPVAAVAQGQDSTPGERNLLIIAELLPGIYDNANQHYFDMRRGLPQADRHARIQTTITRIEAPAFGEHVFLWENRVESAQGPQISHRLAVLLAGPQPDEVTMQHYLRLSGTIALEELATLRPRDLRRTEGCDYFFKRRADHFRGEQRRGACRFVWEGQPVYTENEISLSRSSLWFVDH